MDTGTILNPSRRLNRYENYKVDTAIPMHHVTFNGIAELPVGKGKRFLGNAGKFLNALLGGYQLAFVGQVCVAVLPGGLGKLGRHQPGSESTEVRCSGQ